MDEWPRDHTLPLAYRLTVIGKRRSRHLQFFVGLADGVPRAGARPRPRDV